MHSPQSSILIIFHIQGINMPFNMRPGCKVEARVGPFRVETIGDKIGIQSERERRKWTECLVTLD